MVLVDVDIIAGSDDGYAGRAGFSATGTGYTQTTSALYTAETLMTVATNQQRYQYPNTITPTFTKTTNNDFLAYFLFKGITIPQGSTIEDATFTFTGLGTTGVGAGAGQLKIEGRKTASPTVPTGVGASLFTKPVASSYGTEALTNTTMQTTINSDVAGIIQELVDAFDYNNDNMMLMVSAVKQVLPAGTTTSVQNENELRAFEFGGATIPNLTINYTGPAPTSNGFMLDPQTEKVTFGVVSDGTHSGIARAIADEFGVSESFKDDFSTDNFTNVAGTKVGVNTTTEVMDWQSSGTGIYNEGEVVDLLGVNVDSTKWVLRFKLDINTLIEGTDGTANDLFVGLSDDNTSLPNVSQNYLGWRITAQNDVSTSKWAITDSLNQIMYNTTDILVPTTEPVAGVFYVE